MPRKPSKTISAPRLTQRLHRALWGAERPLISPSLYLSGTPLTFMQKKSLASFDAFVENIKTMLEVGGLTPLVAMVWRRNDYWQVNITAVPKPPGYDLLCYAERSLESGT